MRSLNTFRQHQDVQHKMFRIMILEDSKAFNLMLTRQLEHYTTILAMERNCQFEINSYTSPDDFIRNLRNDTDIAFIDYYLENGVTGGDIVKKIQERCWDCKIVIVSGVRNVKTLAMRSTDESIDFVFKDTNALPRCCLILEDIVDGSLSKYTLN